MTRPIHEFPSAGAQCCEAAAAGDGFTARPEAVTCPRCRERLSLPGAPAPADSPAPARPRPSSFAGTVRSFLNRDHARIEGLHDMLLDEIAAQDRANVEDLWLHLQDAVLRHMEAEERHLLVPFAEGHPGDAAALRSEHVELKEMLEHLRTHLAVPALMRFITAFAAHARREDPLLYEWAEHEVDRATQDMVMRELRGLDRSTTLGR